MSIEEERIQNQIKPFMEAMVLELTKNQPKDVVSSNINCKYSQNL
jgi:hypothetical protein